MTNQTYPNGVSVTRDRLYNADFQTIIIPPAAIQSTGWRYVDTCGRAESVDADIVFNWSPFARCNLLNEGLKIGGGEVKPYDQVNYAPFAYWQTNLLKIDHSLKTWRGIFHAAQGWRYIIQDGVKNSRWSASASSAAAWGVRDARQFLAARADGATIIVSTRDGWTLHEAAAYAIDTLHASFMIDGDGGGSVQTAIRYADAHRDIFQGTGEKRYVPVFGYVNLKQDLSGGTTPPPPTGKTKTHDIDIYEDGSIDIDGVPYG